MKKSQIAINWLLGCGERGIRTPGTPFEVRRFSKPVVSATHPPHQKNKHVG